MRKAQKQQVEDLLGQMKDAQGQIKKYIGQGNIPQAMELLEDCQNGAITIGTLIENTEYEGHPTVSLLEAYCELIYRIYQKLEENNKEINTDKCDKQLRQKLIKVVNSVKNDIPAKTEAVFLPYKASMWDSLESVWKETDRDPNCDAYVVPIPYYDKNPDGSFGEMHYEGNQYPDYVPIIPYEAYDLQTRKPDVIYIHNPYDECNYVTTVHPSYYSKKLKEYTKTLVYIPYFMLEEVKPDEAEQLEGVKHFCLTPGVINAHKVIVQSEEMRKAYIKVLTGAFGEDSREYWTQKILGLGSPKVDKVLNTRKEDLEIPEEWLRIIKKPDGSLKRVVFYNTSIASLLRNRQDMINKIQYVLQYFEKHTDSVALLWRPHPLYENTISAMLPFLLPQYRKLVDSYREKKYGVYDESGDLHRAISLADIYYGDGSSVVQLFKRADKPIMIQAGTVRSFCRQNCFYGKNIILEENDMWLPTAYCSTLLHIDREKGKITCIGEISGENKIAQYMYTDIVKCKDTFYFAATSAARIAKYSQEKGFEYIEFPLEYKHDFYKNSLEAYFVEDGTNLYLIGARRSNTVIRIDKENDHLEKLRGIKLGSEEQLGHSAVIVKGKLYITVASDKPVLYEYDLKNNIAELKRVGCNNAYTVTIDHWKDVFYITLSNGNFIVWDGQTLVKEFVTENVESFITSIVWKDTLWLFPRKENERVYLVSLTDMRIDNSFQIGYVVSSVHCDKDKLLLNTCDGIFEMSSDGEIKEFLLEYGQGQNELAVVSEWNPGWEFEQFRYEGNPQYNTLDNFVEYIIENEDRYGEIVKYGSGKFKNKNIGADIKQCISKS